MDRSRIDEFFTLLEERAPVFLGEVERSRQLDTRFFDSVAGKMLAWAEGCLGGQYLEVLVDGYCEFVVGAARAQVEYERRGSYAEADYASVYGAVYDSPECMAQYHWGAYTLTFGWSHHLSLCRFFVQTFLPRVARAETSGLLLDLGCGSGIWHFLFLDALAGWRVLAVDISETSLRLAERMARQAWPDAEVDYRRGDAVQFVPEEPVQAALCCMLLEHLEEPIGLLRSLANTLPPHGLAFVACALTAAEVDHIHEFRRESEVVALAERAGFRVLATHSDGPGQMHGGRRFLPRSMGLVLQKRVGEFW